MLIPQQASTAQSSTTHTHTRLKLTATMAVVNRKTSTMVAAVAVVVALLLASASSASAAITCGQVGTALAPCIPYATGRASALPSSCCSGVRSLNGQARSSSDRQAACRCLKSLANSVKSVNMGTVATIPGKCGVSVPFPISMSTDCNKYVYIVIISGPSLPSSLAHHIYIYIYLFLNYILWRMQGQLNDEIYHVSTYQCT